jgi:hypothetical protein
MRFLLSLFVSSLLLLNTGCFEILEEVDMNSDGSGTVTLTVDLSESKANISNYMEMNEVQGVAVPSKKEIEQEVARIKKALASSPGISEVRANSDFENFVFSVSGNFDKVNHLNNAVNNVIAAVNRFPFSTMDLDNFDYTDSSFRRYFNYPVSMVDYQGLPTMYQYMLESARMVSMYRFQRPIRTCTNEKAVVSGDKRTIRLQHTLGEIIRGTGTIENSVLF